MNCRAILIGLFPSILLALPAESHVKWFLAQKEAKILSQPKPDLFTHPSFENVSVIVLGLIFLYLTIYFGNKLKTNWLNQKLMVLSQKWEPIINLAVGITTGGALISSSLNHCVFAPNMPICSHCPAYILPLELMVGAGLAMGFCTPICAIMLIAQLLTTFIKFSFGDCLDLFPFYGAALYFLVRGRGPLSVDALLNLNYPQAYLPTHFAYACLRWGIGLGLIILALDEKLIHPQLALSLLSAVPCLNFFHSFGMDNATFVLCSGVAETVLGAILILGSFPRVAVILIAALFTVTTAIFGLKEFYGHMAYYGVIFAILLRGDGRLGQPVTRINSRLTLPVNTSAIFAKILRA